MKNIINKFLLAADKFMPEMHLRHLRYLALVGIHTRRNKNKIT